MYCVTRMNSKMSAARYSHRSLIFPTTSDAFVSLAELTSLCVVRLLIVLLFFCDGFSFRSVSLSLRFAFVFCLFRFCFFFVRGREQADHMYEMKSNEKRIQSSYMCNEASQWKCIGKSLASDPFENVFSSFFWKLNGYFLRFLRCYDHFYQSTFFRRI